LLPGLQEHCVSLRLWFYPICLPTDGAAANALTVSAAISLNAMQEIKSLYQRRNPNVNITYNFGASALQQQIEQSAG